jgi:hypothetical protein
VHRHLNIVVGVLASACAGHSTESLPEGSLISEIFSPGTGCVAPAGSSTYSVITAAELQWTRAANLYDAIRRLRPAYFEIRGPASIYHGPAAPVVVIVNRHVIGEVDELRSMDVTDLACVRRLSAADVSLMTGAVSSAIGIELIH